MPTLRAAARRIDDRSKSQFELYREVPTTPREWRRQVSDIHGAANERSEREEAASISLERAVALIEIDKPFDLVDQRRDLRASLINVSSVKEDATFDAIEKEEHVPDIRAARTPCRKPVEVCRA